MNIFYLHQNPQKCAQYHNDRHCVKMILETAQIASTTHHALDSHESWMYRPTHINHPCCVWARETGGNYIWLTHLGIELCEEYSKRYDKTHKTTEIMLGLLDNIPPKLQNSINDFTPVAQAMPEQYRNENPIKAYRDYYIGDKQHIAQWKTKRPYWYKANLA